MNPNTSSTDHARFAEWDAAYVLGSLSPSDRRDYEAHLETCDRCRDAVAGLTSMPGLLGRVSSEQAMSLLADPAAIPDAGTEGASVTAPTGPRGDLIELVREEDRRRRRTSRTRLIAGLSAAAALVIAAAVAVPIALSQPEQPTQTVVLDQIGDNPLSATIGLTEKGWGTKIDVECSYASDAATTDPDEEWAFALWVTDEAGASSEVSSWTAKNGWTVELDAASAVQYADITTVDIRSLDTGKVLLSKEID